MDHFPLAHDPSLTNPTAPVQDLTSVLSMAPANPRPDPHLLQTPDTYDTAHLQASTPQEPGPRMNRLNPGSVASAAKPHDDQQGSGIPTMDSLSETDLPDHLEQQQQQQPQQQQQQGPPTCNSATPDMLATLRKIIATDPGNAAPRERFDKKIPYTRIIAEALSSSPNMELKLNRIYEYCDQTYDMGRLKQKWQNGIRNWLSLTFCFVRMGDEGNTGSRGGTWTYDRYCGSPADTPTFIDRSEILQKKPYLYQTPRVIRLARLRLQEKAREALHADTKRNSIRPLSPPPSAGQASMTFDPQGLLSPANSNWSNRLNPAKNLHAQSLSSGHQTWLPHDADQGVYNPSCRFSATSPRYADNQQQVPSFVNPQPSSFDPRSADWNPAYYVNTRMRAINNRSMSSQAYGSYQTGWSPQGAGMSDDGNGGHDSVLNSNYNYNSASSVMSNRYFDSDRTGSMMSQYGNYGDYNGMTSQDHSYSTPHTMQSQFYGSNVRKPDFNYGNGFDTLTSYDSNMNKIMTSSSRYNTTTTNAPPVFNSDNSTNPWFADNTMMSVRIKIQQYHHHHECPAWF